MFFEISKVGGFFLQPLNFSLLLLVLGLILLALGRGRLAFTTTFGALLVLALSAWSSLGSNLMSPLEERFARPDPAPENVTGIIVLGGGLEGSINLARGGYELNSSGDRFVEGAILARRHPAAKLLISGGSGALILVGEGDADTAPRLLSALGVDPSRLVLENRSRNTEENARFSKELANPQPGETWLLVTSAFHMPRSMGLFQKAGFAVLPWPVDYRTAGDEGIGFFVDNPLDSLTKSTLASREWIGLFTYWWTGKIDTPFPGP
ncbi:MAG TPA: YdcF family protein [Rhizobiaceae bacterium]|nr:YdcF family protein [Rhizobiaceae bacterium]